MSDDSDWITTSEAAQRLGVKRATLYAYVSRGTLHSQRRPGQQESLFDRHEIDTLASTTRASGTPQALLRFRGVSSTISSQIAGELHYRGMPLSEVIERLTFAQAAALVMGSATNEADEADEADEDAPLAESDQVRALAPDVMKHLPLNRRLPVAIQFLAAADAFAGDTDPNRVRRAAAPLIAAALPRLGATADLTRRGTASVPWVLTSMLQGRHADQADTDLMRVLLTSLLDHGLTASTVAARVAASTRAGLADCLCAAYATLSGPLHGAAPTAARALMDHPGSPREAVAESVRIHGAAPGFGHFLYPEGDPRAELIFEALGRRRGTAALRKRVAALSKVVADHSGLMPNVDLASAAALSSLGLPAASGEVVFQVARSYGVAAHVVEEYREEPLRWRGRETAR